MLSCYSNAKCDPAANDDYGPTCGSTVGAVIFFCSFIFLCMFLVSSHGNVKLHKHCLISLCGWLAGQSGWNGELKQRGMMTVGKTSL